MEEEQGEVHVDDKDPTPARPGQAGPSEAPRGPTATWMGRASPAGPGGPGWEPEEGLKSIPDEPGNEDGAAERSNSKSSCGQ